MKFKANFKVLGKENMPLRQTPEVRMIPVYYFNQSYSAIVNRIGSRNSNARNFNFQCHVLLATLL